jgi:hypothetical protein
MTHLRVHELAKQLGITSRELLARLDELGLPARGPSSKVSKTAIEQLQNGTESPRKDALVRATPGLPRADIHGLPIGLIHPNSRPITLATGWSAGAIPVPRHPELLANIQRVGRSFPVFFEHLDALRRLGSQVVYAAFCREEGYRDCAVVHIRFSGALETGFGFTREVLAFYSPFRDLQVRTFEAALREIGRTDREITPDAFFSWSPDPRLKIKLQDWSRPSRVAIPFLISSEDPLSLVSLLREHIHSRDLFYITTPVSGANFFGRRTMLQSLRDDVLSQRAVGLFGLRKSGKTSILMQLQEDLQDDGVVAVLMDLEAFPAPPDDPTDDLLADLRKRLLDELRSRRYRTKELADLPERPSILQLKNALQEILKYLHRDGRRIFLMLDEIEYLTPSDRVDVAEGAMPRVAQFLASLRSIVQETDNFTFMLSGLTSAIIESGRLYGRPNPLFSWAKAVYVGPLNREDANDLAITMGGKMGIQIDDGALDALHDASGGHAYLYRNLASAVVSNLPTNALLRRITKPMVLVELEDWASRAQGNIEEMVEHLKRYYPTEAVLLEILLEDPTDFADLASSERVAVRRLSDLGLVRATDGIYLPSVMLELL